MPRYYRKVIKIRADDSPNVRLALQQIARGEEPTGEVLVPGVLTWDEYKKRRKLWDKIQQCVSLDADFYKGAEVYLFPKEVLTRAVELAIRLKNLPRRARSMGVDSAEGGDDTVWTIIDRLGIIFQLSIKTQDTADIPGTTLGLMREYHLSPENVFFDRGGGGLQHVHRLRRMGHDVRTIGFGESAKDANKDRKTSTIGPRPAEKVETTEAGYAYKNRRAEMYGLTSQLLASETGFAIDSIYGETLRQLKVIPKLYDGEGRLYLPPKDKTSENYTGRTLKQMLGRSPDQADSLVLAVFGMLRKPTKRVAGAI